MDFVFQKILVEMSSACHVIIGLIGFGLGIGLFASHIRYSNSWKFMFYVAILMTWGLSYAFFTTTETLLNNLCFAFFVPLVMLVDACLLYRFIDNQKQKEESIN